MKTDLCFNPRSIRMEEIYRNLPSILKVFQKNQVSIAYIFGSILYGDSSKDLDVGVFFKGKKRSSIELYSDFYFDLCSIFRADNIDVAILNDTGPAFRYEVISKGKLVFFIHESEVIEFIETTLFNYEDTKKFRRESHEELKASVREGLMKERKINIQRVDSYLKNLKEAILEIQRLVSLAKNINEFISPDKKDIRNLSVHHLRIALESVLDISRHIIAVKGFGIADLETGNLIDILGKNGVIPFDFSQKIRGMAGMRNAIVHVYWNLDYEEIYEMIKNRLVDFEDFARYILEYMEREK